ncbi:MAG: DUF3298 domain-containing protein [Bacteroidetes bacterium]|nr:DUF3298 domain-containing protein [Bacteroidota bacterium]
MNAMRKLTPLLFLLITCLADAQTRMPVNFYMHLKGQINENFNIKADLVKRGDSLFGHYEYVFSEYDNTSYYIYIGNTIEMKGIALSNGTIKLFEPPFGKSSLFEGRFVNQKRFSGHWIGPDGNLKIPFDLSEEYANGSVPLNVFSLKDSVFITPKSRQPKAILDLLLLFPAESGNVVMSDSLRKIIAEKFSEGSHGSLNPDSIINNIRRLYFGNFKLYQSPSTDSSTSMKNWSKSKTMEVVLNDGNLLTLKIIHKVSIGEGSPKKVIDAITVFLKNARIVGLADLIRESYLPKINEMVDSKIREKFHLSPSASLKDAGFFADRITTFDQVFITRQGIGFFFNEYSIAGPETGGFEVIVPFQEVGDGLFKDGVLSELLH